MSSSEALDRLRGSAVACERCALAETRTNVVFSSGDPSASVMLIGEAPGRNEDLTGEPFVGAAGKLLDSILGGAGLARADVYIANILKCRPPGNRDPRPEETSACTPYLLEQVRLVAPRVIVTLGNHASRFILGTKEGITTLRGRAFRSGTLVVVPVFHPAAVIRDPSKRSLLEDDLRLAVRIAEGEDVESEPYLGVLA